MRTIVTVTIDGHAKLPLGSIIKILKYLIRERNLITSINVEHAQ